MNHNKCKDCGNKIATHMRSDAVFCSDYCKKRNWDINNRIKLKTALKSKGEVV